MYHTDTISRLDEKKKAKNFQENLFTIIQHVRNEIFFLGEKSKKRGVGKSNTMTKGSSVIRDRKAYLPFPPQKLEKILREAGPIECVWWYG